MSASPKSSQFSQSSPDHDASTSNNQTPTVDTAATTPTDHNIIYVPAAPTTSLKRKAIDDEEEEEAVIKHHVQSSCSGNALPNHGNTKVVRGTEDNGIDGEPPAKRARVAAPVGQLAPGHDGAQMLLDAARVLELRALQDRIDEKLVAADQMEGAQKEIAKLERKYRNPRALDAFGRPSNKKPRKSTPVMDMRGHTSQEPMSRGTPGASSRDPARWGRRYSGKPWLEERESVAKFSAAAPSPHQGGKGIRKGKRKPAPKKEQAVKEKKEVKGEVVPSKKRRSSNLKIDMLNPPTVVEGRTRGRRAKSEAV